MMIIAWKLFNNSNMTSCNNSQRILLDDAQLDKPIYRIFPRKWLLNALTTKQIALVAPRMWDDPFEIVDKAIQVEWREGGKIKSEIIQNLPAVFAQSWSATEESDALLRVYSKMKNDKGRAKNEFADEEGIRVRTTPRKLFEAVSNAMQAVDDDIVCFIGAVEYVSQKDLLRGLANLLYSERLNALESVLNRARLLLKKRPAFVTEAEVRVMAIHRTGRRNDDFQLVSINPNALFDELACDPRLMRAELLERHQELRDLGYTGNIHEWSLYANIIPSIQMPPDWLP